MNFPHSFYIDSCLSYCRLCSLIFLLGYRLHKKICLCQAFSHLFLIFFIICGVKGTFISPPHPFHLSILRGKIKILSILESIDSISSCTCQGFFKFFGFYFGFYPYVPQHVFLRTSDENIKRPKNVSLSFHIQLHETCKYT